MKAAIHRPDGTTIEAEGTPDEIASLVRRLETRVVRRHPALSDAAAAAVTCTCGRVSGCGQHPWMHAPVERQGSAQH